MKKRSKVISSLFVVVLLGVMFFTNPDTADAYSKIKEKEGKLSYVDVSKRINCFLFSFYQVEKLSLKSTEKGSYKYLGILGQVIEL